ncbi:hypothetical protein STEG23_025336, partial [Scotinomys teguina]
TIRVWLKRDSGQYWPSIYHTMASPCSAMAYHHDSRRIFVGQDNGAIMEFHISEDFNKMNFIKTYPAHQNRVSAVVFSLAAEWVVSTGHDKSVSWMCTRRGNMLGRHFFASWASCLQYDLDTQHAFVGDYSGQITLLKLEQSTCSVITTLKGHEGSIACLWWDPLQRLLFSGASDNSIIMWDIGGRKGRTLLLQGHQKCGQAVCGKCSSKRSSYPVMGFEFQVRVCDSCYDSIKDEDRTSLATFHEGKHNIAHMSMDIARGLMVTCGTDRVVKNFNANLMYNRMWHQTQEALNTLLNEESEKMTEPQRNKVIVFQMLATFYIKYVQIFRDMEDVYDQIVHPQKRMLIRKILDGVMGRILELKNEMVELEMTEFHYFDDILQDLKLTPQELDVPIPKYFLKERLEVLKGREKILTGILNECGSNLPNVKFTVKSLAWEEAVNLIQTAERARQGRLRAMLMKQIFLRELRAKEIKKLGKRQADPGLAALQIQKVWQGFHQRKKTVKEREEDMIFLGMKPPHSFNKVSAAVIQSEHVAHLRNEVQLKHEQNYREALVDIQKELRLNEGPAIKERLQDQIRQWFIEYRNLTGTFPEYPTVEEGGSAVIFSNKTPEQVIEDILTSQEEEEKFKRKKKKEEKESKPKKGKKAKERKSNRKEKVIQEEDEEWKMSPSHFLQVMEEGNRLYKETWMNKDESWNFHQDYDPEMIREEKWKELEFEIRVQVDELMREELKNLKLAVDREIEHRARGKKGKKQGKGKKGKKRGKQGKKDRDLTAD